jgi:diguanylate cyclase (GGDEF)-like protein
MHALVRLAVDPAAQRPSTARTAAALFAAAGFVTGLGLVLPHVPEVDVDGLVVVAVVAVATALALLRAGERLPPKAYPLLASLGTLLVSLSFSCNGERHGGPAGGDEAYYILIAFWSAYHLSRRALAAQVAGVLVAYAVTLHLVGTHGNAISRWLTLTGLIVGTAVAVRMLSERVEALVAELRRAALTDPLTGLPNRRGFESAFADELRVHARTGRPFGLLTADVDHFKQLNDRFGHAAGDDALVEVAGLLRASVPADATAARIGGDEFAILLPDTADAPAAAAAGRIAEAVALRAVAAGWPLRISIGMARFAADGIDLDVLMRTADAALYRAKQRRPPARAADAA